MRRIVAFGVCSLAGALFAACGDDEPTPSATGGSSGSSSGGRGGSGSGGRPGGSGASGTAGTTGDGGDGGDGGNAGAAGGNAGTGGTPGNDADAGDGGGGAPCTGCLELRVPVVGNDQGSSIVLDFGFDTPADLRGATVTFRVRALTPNDQLHASPFALDAEYSYVSFFTALSAANGFVSDEAWVDVIVNIGAIPAPDLINVPDAGADAGDGEPDPEDFDNAHVRLLGFQVGSAGAFGLTASETVTVLIDSVTFSNDVPDLELTDSAQGFGFDVGSSELGTELIHHP